jgi:20S proteasome subunit beta 3
MSISEYNGAAIVAMSGKDCVAIGCDLRLGIQNQTLATDFKKVYKIHDRLYLGLAGLATDALTLNQRFQFKHNMYKLREERNMKPATFAHMVSKTLYEKRFGPYFCEPVIAGIDDDGTPYITGMDSLGAMETSKDFMVAGTAPNSLWGVCESFYRPNLSQDELFESISQCLLSGVDRDCLSGWGAVVYVIGKDGSFVKTLKGRMD